MGVLRVALDIPIGRLFDYHSDEVSTGAVGRRVRVPFGRGEKTGMVVAVAEQSELPADRLKSAGAPLTDIPALPPDWLELVAFCSRYYHYSLGEVIALALPPRLKSPVPFRLPPVDVPLAPTPPGIEALAGLPEKRIARRLIALLAAEGPQRRSELKRRIKGSEGALAGLIAQGWVEARPADPAFSAPGPDLLPGQSEVVKEVSACFGRFQPFLLHGITGSGKTEVYLRLVEAALRRRDQCLVLVPEIGLTPQLERQVSERFPHACVARLHSSLAEGERALGYARALVGEADIVIGTRLAVFTPMPRLGLIVVDEEHDPSYKQQDGIRYQARDVAVWRARQRQVPILLGSATPSLESWHLASIGRYRLLQLTERAGAGRLPAVRCIDVRGEKLQEGLSERLLAALEARLQRAEQSLVFLNRRGYAPVLACPACAWVSRCDHCSANRVLHLADRRLRCHHCGTEAPLPAACPACGNQDVRPFGRGTQRLEEALAARFPAARILRIDRDSASTPARWQQMLAQIHAGEADVLVGTQMLAKGHDFPRLTLVGVLNADASLFAADFRAPERLFAQLMQVGGRSGRAALEGAVVIQTEFPDHPLYHALARNDYAGFARRQLEERKAAGFPPASHQALLRAEARALPDALAFLREAARLGEALGSGVRIYDAVPMRMARRADWERAQLLVESPRRPLLHRFLDAWLAALREAGAPRELRWHLDVDPLEF